MKKSIALLISAILGFVYAILTIGLVMGWLSAGTFEELLAGFIVSIFVTPHMILVGIANVFIWIAFFINKPWAALTGAIIYCGAGLIFLPFIFFVIPLIVLSFVGYARVRKRINKANANPV